MKVNGIRIYEVTPEVLTYYRQKVKHNQHTSDELIAKKLTRNILAGDLMSYNLFTRKKVYQYGFLQITCKGKKVVEIQNRVGEGGQVVNKQLKEELNQLLGIN